MTQDVFGIVGKKIAGAYQVDSPVAEGGFGVVYRARHRGFRADVALKCLKIPQQLGAKQHATFLEQFRREAELLFKLSASIQTVVRPLHVDAFTSQRGDFVPYMVLEWLEGETLDAVMYRRFQTGQPPYSLREVMELLAPVAQALDRAHNFVGPEGPISIVHSDLKPENIFVANVAGQRHLKILDFGLASVKSIASQAEETKGDKSNSGLALFTPAYGAPEQWMPRAFGPTGAWTDVWGLALVAVELLVGGPVIDGDHAAMMGRVMDPARRPTPRTEGVAVSDAVEAVFLKALAVEPGSRYRDAGDFWRELEKAASAEIGLKSREELSSPGADLEFEPTFGRGATQAPGEFELGRREPSNAGGQRPGAGWLEDTGNAARGLELEVEQLPQAARAPAAPHVREGHASVSSEKRPSEGRPAMAPALAARQASKEAAVLKTRALLSRVKPGIWLLGAALVITLLNVAYTKVTGELLRLGPMKLNWGAATLGLGGIGQIVFELMRIR